MPSRECAGRYHWAARWVLLVVFVAHNLEEVGTGGRSGPVDPAVAERLGVAAELYRADRFALATLFLTVAVAAALLPARPEVRTSRALVVVAAAAALAANGVSHLVRAAVEGQPGPGVWSAPALLAVSAVALIEVRAAARLGTWPTVLAAIAGAVVSVPAIALALGLASALLR